MHKSQQRKLFGVGGEPILGHAPVVRERNQTRGQLRDNRRFVGCIRSKLAVKHVSEAEHRETGSGKTATGFDGNFSLGVAGISVLVDHDWRALFPDAARQGQSEWDVSRSHDHRQTSFVPHHVGPVTPPRRLPCTVDHRRDFARFRVDAIDSEGRERELLQQRSYVKQVTRKPIQRTRRIACDQRHVFSWNRRLGDVFNNP